MNYNSHKLFKWNHNNILYNETTNKYTDVYLQTGSINLEKTVEKFEWHNSLCYTHINNELKIIENSNHFTHTGDYGEAYNEVIYSKIVRNYYEFNYEFTKNYYVTSELFNNTLDQNKLYFYMIDSFVFTNSGHNLSILLDQIQYIIDNNIKDILILKNSQNTNNFKIIKLLMPTECVFYELDFNTIYKIKNIIIIYPEYYNIYKHENLISQLKDKVYKTYKNIYNDCFNKNIILIKKQTFAKTLVNPVNCDKLVSYLTSKNWIDIDPENIDVFKMCVYLLTAKNIICSDGSIVYTNKIFFNNNSLVFCLINRSRIYYDNFRSINKYCLLYYDNETLNTKSEVFRITSIIESNLSSFYILDNKRLTYTSGNETYINMDKSYGSYVDSFEEALNLCKNNKNCKQIVYNKKDKCCFPMTQWNTNLASPIDDEDWISAYRYDNGNFDKVAIIIPTYNRFNLLKKTLESAINQTYKNIDIFITDDNSSEYNIEQFNYITEMQEKYNNITYINNKENKGFCKNINTALKLLTKEHEYFHILFDDDWIEPEYIETAVNIFNVHKNISFVEFRALNHINKEHFTDYFPDYSNIVDINSYMKNLLINNDSIITSCVSPCNRVFKNLGIFFEENNIDNIDEKCLRNGSGYDFIFIYKHLKIYNNFFYYSEKPLCNFLSHDGAESCNNADFVIKNTILGIKWCINDYLIN